MFRKLFNGNKYVACYFFALTVFTLSSVRNYAYQRAVREQPKLDFEVDPVYIKSLSWVLYTIGMTLVLTSHIQLGITGTYCGDYFGILMKRQVTGFPFNVVHNPMYLGSTFNFLAFALAEQSFAGLLLTVLVNIVYNVYSIWLENPFTAYIYSEKERTEKGSKLK